MTFWPSTVRQAEAWRGGVVLAARVVVTVATVVAAAAIAVRDQAMPKLSLWIVFVPLAIASVGQVVDTIVRSVHNHQAPQRVEDEQDLRQAVMPLLQDVTKAGNVDIAKVGICVWVVGNYRPFLREPRLKRILRFRLDPSVANPSPVDWQRGKGAIGEVWETRKKKHVDWRPIAAKYAGGVTDATWERMPSKTRHGFERAEFEAVCDKYAEILAVPIIDSQSGDLYGVLSVDLPMDAVPEDAAPVLARKTVEKKVAAAAGLLALTVKRRRV